MEWRPVIGDALVSQHVRVVSELPCPVDKEPDELSEGEPEHPRVRGLVVPGLRVVFVPDAGDVAVLAVPVLVIHGGQHPAHGGQVHAVPGHGPHPLDVAGARAPPGQPPLTAHGPLLPDELVLVTPVLKYSQVSKR